MKKIIASMLIILVLIGGVFVLTGCSNKESGTYNEANLHKLSFVDLKYNEVKNFSRKENTVDWDDYKVRNYFFGEDSDKNIKLIWYKAKDDSFLISEGDSYTEKTINNINWKITHDTDFGVTYDTYSSEYNGDLYIIELNGVDKYQKEFDEFMNDVAF